MKKEYEKEMKKKWNSKANEILEKVEHQLTEPLTPKEKKLFFMTIILSIEHGYQKAGDEIFADIKDVLRGETPLEDLEEMIYE